MEQQQHEIVYPTMEEFFLGLRVFRLHNPEGIVRTFRDPKGTKIGVRGDRVFHSIRLETFRAYYCLVGSADPVRQRKSYTAYYETLKEILGDMLK